MVLYGEVLILSPVNLLPELVIFAGGLTDVAGVIGNIGDEFRPMPPAPTFTLAPTLDPTEPLAPTLPLTLLLDDDPVAVFDDLELFDMLVDC